MRLITAIALGLAISTTEQPARADPPLMPRSAVWTKCSLDRRTCATVDRRHGRTTVRRAGHAVWSAAAVPDSLSVSNDGATLVEQYRGANLLEADAGPATVMLVFHDRARIVRRVTLHDFYSDLNVLPKSVSHRIWANDFGFDGDGSYIVDTVDGRRFRYTLSGAKLTVGKSPAR